MIDKVYYMVMKNFLLIFRNWTSFTLLILGPFFLVIIVGLILGTATYQDVPIGLVGDFSQVQEVVEARFELQEFSTSASCLASIAQSKTVVCVDLSDSGSISIQYDNSKLSVSQTVVGFLTQHIDAASRTLAVDSAQDVFSQIGTLEDFLKSANTSIASFVQQGESVSQNLEVFQSELNKTKQNFEPIYTDLLRLQENATNQTILTVIDTFRSDIIRLQGEVNETKQQVMQMREVVVSQNESFSQIREIQEEKIVELLNFYNENKDKMPSSIRAEFEALQLEQMLEFFDQADFDQVSDALVDSLNRLEQVEELLEQYDRVLLSARLQIPGSITQFDSVIDQASQIFDFIEFSQEQTNQTIYTLEENAQAIVLVQAQLQDIFLSFDEVSNVDVEQLLNPLTAGASPAIEDASPVQLYFPLIISLIILFLSILFSNIIMLNEIYSSAQLRNFILPLQDFFILLSFFLTNLIIILFQIAILVIFMQIRLDVQLLHQIPTIFFVSFFLSAFFILLGMVIAYVTHSKENSILLTTFVSLGFFLFSSFLVSLEMQTRFVSFFVSLNPIVISKEILRKAVLFDLGFFTHLASFFQLLFYVFILAVLLYFVVARHRFRFN
ncbi:MAG: hypothetical protein ACMXYF_05065 [Candidatus Woesearchaeota archaeon]